MLKHYVFWQFRKWIPLLIVFTALLTSIGGSTALSIPTASVTFNGRGSSSVNPAMGAFPFVFFPALALSFVMAFFIYSYRTRRSSVDVFYQAPYSPTTIKRVRVLLGLAILMASITAAYFITVSLYAMRYFATPISRVVRNGTDVWEYTRLACHFEYYLYAYFVIILAVAAQYFVNCFLAGLGDYVMDQIFLVLFGNLFLCLFLIGPALYAGFIARIDSPEYAYLFLYGLGPVGPSSLNIVMVFLMQEIVITPDNSVLMHSIIATIISFAFGCGCGVINLFLPDPSGESANVRGARNNTIALIPHGAALSLGFIVACGGGIFSSTGYVVYTNLGILPLFLFSLFGIAYYCLLALWRHSWKPAKLDLICYLSVTGTTLILTVVNMIVQASYAMIH